MLDTKAIAAALAPVLKQHIEAATEPLRARIAELEARAPTPGQNGKDGRDGRDAEPVSDEQLAKVVERYLEANPPKDGADGKDGLDGKDGADGVDGKDGQNGKDGRDGVGVAGALIDRDGELNLTLSNGEIHKMGLVVGRDGKDGADGTDGADGQSWDEMEVRRTGPRTIELSFDHGDRRNTFEVEFPVPLYRGVYSDAEVYQVGDMVTWAGSLWHCNESTTGKPGEGTKAWTLAVKRGRDGKDFAGPQPKTGPVKI